MTVRRSGTVLVAIAAILGLPGAGAEEITTAYQRAANYVPWRIPSWLTVHETHAARWSDDGGEFRYYSYGPEGNRLIIGDGRTGRTRQAESATDTPRPRLNLDPQKRWGVGLEGFNLWLVDGSTAERFQLTTDGREDDSYSALYEFGVLLDAERAELHGPMRAAQGAWSADGRYFASFHYDQRSVGSSFYWYAVTDKGYGARAQYYQQRGAYPGEPNAYAELVICDTRERHCRSVKEARFETFLDPFTAGLVQWSADSRSVYFILEGRGLRSATVERVDLADGKVTPLYTEESKTYLMLSGARYPAIWSVLRDGRRMLWFSERDGWETSTSSIFRPARSAGN